MCTGVADEICPGDVFEPSTTECRASAGVCDVADNCTGSAAACPADAVEPSTTECRAQAGFCDIEENCDGTAVTCPADELAAGKICNPGSGDLCDPDEFCTGTDAACPVDTVASATIVCRTGSGDICDPDELCTGVADEICPGDVVEPDGTSCVDGTVCNGDETCQSGSCAAGTPLSCDDANECTADSCDAVTACVNTNIALGTPCSIGVCDGAGMCVLDSGITACEKAGGTYDHWDKIIFTSEGAALRDSGGAFIKPGTVLEFKFPQLDPSQPVNVAQLTADHLNSIGWTLGNGNMIKAGFIVIIDVDYRAVCVLPTPV